MKRKYVQAMMTGMTAMLAVTVPVTTVAAATPEKEQTVYVNADQNGNVEKVIVSNWLKNTDKESTLEDNSELNDITNVKGEESYTQGSNGKLVWAADGNDIYYQGETSKELPVSVKMTYFLDGREISAADLAGKSGKVKIRIDYTNNSSQNAKINGKKETIYTPFMMATGMILPTDTFTNVEVTNGKVISDGNNNIVLGIGFPGLYDSLKLSDLDSFKDKESPDYVEITADVEDFSLALTATVATTGTLNELGLDDIDDLDDLQDSLDKLTESSTALVEGSRALQEGIQELDSSADTLVDGLNSADDGAGQLKDVESERLQRHVRFLYAKGSMYRIYNGNLIFHGCVPLDENGKFLQMTLQGKTYSGKQYMDFMDKVARQAYFKRDSFSLDCMWFLWCGDNSPLCGRQIKTFPRAYCLDRDTWAEPQNPYYQYHTSEQTCAEILHAFGLDNPDAHIINGHTPIKVSKGESPIKANGRLIVIDGGFCRAYQKTTGIAGYTLIYNSHGLRLMSHQPFTSISEALEENKDIHSHSEIFETSPHRMMVSDCDNGKIIQEKIKDLEMLLTAYRQGILTPEK